MHAAAQQLSGFERASQESFGNVPQALGYALGVPDLKLDARLTGPGLFEYVDRNLDVDGSRTSPT